MRTADAAFVRAVIARCWLDEAGESRTLGAISLRDHQSAAVGQLRSAMREFGGALLADAVGLGKTYVALRLASEARRPLVVSPAALRSMWSAAAAAADVRVDHVSHESLSRAVTGAARPRHDLLIVDEAHHARNPATRRYRALAALAADVPVLLLSATPLHNRARDLEALLALFLGARAWTLSPSELGRCVVRREHDGVPECRLPRVAPPQWIALSHDEGVLHELLALPPPVPPSDGGDGGVLLAHALIRRWASSDAALRATLRRRLGQATALTDSLAAGRYPTRAEMRAWTQEDAAVQLAFPDFVAARDVSDARALLDAIRAHADAVRAMLVSTRSARCDAERATRLIELRSRHAREKMVAFTVFAETATALFGHLRGQPRAAMLTARGARIASGPLTREEVLARFAPLAAGGRPPHRREAIDLLITTDLLSEGVNLQDASVVVHLDLPWTPARLEQRVGRVARMGSTHPTVSVYALSPPARAEVVLGVERRLGEKLQAARRSVGITGTILPGLLDSVRDETNPPGARERLRETLRGWRRSNVTRRAGPVLHHGFDGALEPVVAAVRSDRHGFLALLLARPAPPTLIASFGSAADDAPWLVASAAACALGEEVPVDSSALALALAAVEAWCTSALVDRDLDLRRAAAARARRTVIRRIASISARTPPDRRANIAMLAAKARLSATVTCGVGAEHVLAGLADATLSDEAWLMAVGTFGELHRTHSMEGGARPELAALILFQ